MSTFASMDTLMHYGILGMKWGIRKDRKSKGFKKHKTDKKNTAKTKTASDSNSATKTPGFMELVTKQNKALRNVEKALLGEDKGGSLQRYLNATAKAYQIILGTAEPPELFGPNMVGNAFKVNDAILNELSNVSASRIKTDPEYAKMVAIGYTLYLDSLH